MSELNNTAGVLTQQIEAIGCPHCDAELNISGNDLFDVFACPECENEITTPGRFGDFILTGKLGQGGMGAVFLGIDEKLGREVALKVNRKEFGDNPKFLERFSIEAQAMARFNHPNVVQIYSYGQEYGQPYMCTEYVTGGDLASQMVAGEALDQVAMLHVAKDLAEGLQAAKDNGLIHGDIKPENVMFDERGNAKIMDFGLAKFGGGEEGKPKEVWGTPYYIAPEKAKKQGEDHLSDQYSLGAALYHTLAGRPPFDGDTPRDVVVARLQDDAPPLWQVNPYVSKKTSAIVERMMSRSPSSRYPTYASMQADFANAIKDAEANPGPYVYEEAAAPKKKFPVLPVVLGGGGLLALLLGGLVFAFATKDKPELAPAPAPGQGTVTGTDPAKPELIVSSDRTDNKPFTSSQLKKLESARKNFMDGKGFQGETDLFAAMEKAKDDRIGRQWINLFQAMVYKQKGETRGFHDQLDKVIGSKIKYTEGKPPKNSPVHYAKYLKGQMSEAEFQSKRKSFAPSFQHLADYATALRAADSAPGKFAATTKAYIDGKGGPNENWPYILQGHAKSLASQAGTVQSKIDQAAKDKSKARGLLEGQRKANGYSKIWYTVLDKELKKYPAKAAPPPRKPTPKPPPEKAAPKEPTTQKTPEKPAVVDTPEPTPPPPAADPKQSFADWEKPAIAAAKQRDFDKAVGALGAFETDDPARDEKADIIRGIYENMPAMHAAVVDKAPSLSFTRKVGSKTGKLINGDKEGILIGVGGGLEVPVKWGDLTANEYFQLAKQALSKSAAPNKVKAKHLFSLAYLAKLEGNKPYGRAFAAGVRALDPELAKMFGKL